MNQNVELQLPEYFLFRMEFIILNDRMSIFILNSRTKCRKTSREKTIKFAPRNKFSRKKSYFQTSILYTKWLKYTSGVTIAQINEFLKIGLVIFIWKWCGVWFILIAFLSWKFFANKNFRSFFFHKSWIWVWKLFSCCIFI